MSDDLRSTVEQVGRCFNSRDLDGLDAIVDEDLVNHAAGPQGREGWKLVWQSIVTCFPDAVADTHAILIDGDQAAVHMTLRGTHRESAMPLLAGVPPTNNAIEWEFIHLFRLRDGKVVEHSAVRDDLGLLRQLGVA